MASDKDLLSRLNALKPSTVSLESGQNAPSVDIEVSSPEDRLADRLKSLRHSAAGGSGVASPSSSISRRKETLLASPADSFTARVRDEVTAESDPIRDWQSHDADEGQSLDDLLAELGDGENQWKVDNVDQKDLKALLRDARAALPKNDGEHPTAYHSDADLARIPPSDLPGQSVEAGNDVLAASDHDDEEPDQKAQDQRDEAEADDYVARVLAELDVEKKYGIRGEEDEIDDHADKNQRERGSSSAKANDLMMDHGLDLPSAPSKLPSLPPGTSNLPPSYEESELESRFSKLGLSLPSTPSTKPTLRTKRCTKPDLPSVRQQGKSRLPKFTDEDMESWCCICNEDGEVRCFGCDGDIYCNSCWQEGHGNRPGQERGHRAVVYNKGGGSGAVAA